MHVIKTSFFFFGTCTSVYTMYSIRLPLCAVILVSCCQLLHVEAVLWSPQPAPSDVSGCTVFSPIKSSIVPRGPVNWLITSLMRHVAAGHNGRIVRWSSDF